LPVLRWLLQVGWEKVLWLLGVEVWAARWPPPVAALCATVQPLLCQCGA